jgi:hypothetical protein
VGRMMTASTPRCMPAQLESYCNKSRTTATQAMQMTSQYLAILGRYIYHMNICV